MLREDNADQRLMKIGHELGLVTRDALAELESHQAQIASEIARLQGGILKASPTVNARLARQGARPIEGGVCLETLLRRVGIDYDVLSALAPPPQPLPPRVARQVEIAIKYEGYIQRQRAEIEKFRHLEHFRVPEGFDYHGVHGLSNELKEKLERVRPVSLGQASRIDGMTPAALSVLMIAIRARARRG